MPCHFELVLHLIRGTHWQICYLGEYWLYGSKYRNCKRSTQRVSCHDKYIHLAAILGTRLSITVSEI